MPKKPWKKSSDDPAINGLKVWENFIQDNIKEFEAEFCFSLQLIDVYFSADWMRVVWITEQGMSINNVFPISKFLEFFKKHQ